MLRALAIVGHLVLIVLSLRGVRWAYLLLIIAALVYFPLRVGFHFNPQPCEVEFGPRLALFSLTNYSHIALCALFFVITSAQVATLPLSTWARFAWAGAAVLVMGALVELAEGVTGQGHCRLRDLIPDAAGALLGAAVLLSWWRVRRRLSA